MTGNTKVWRAPLAGLASLAMVATMGVSALTANAAAVDFTFNVTSPLKFDKEAAAKAGATFKSDTQVTVKDADGKLDPATVKAAEGSLAAHTDYTLTGWFSGANAVATAAAVDPNATATDLTAHVYRNSDVYTVNFGTQANAVFGGNDKLASWQVPQDTDPTDGNLLKGWKSATQGGSTIDFATADLTQLATQDTKQVKLAADNVASTHVEFDLNGWTAGDGFAQKVEVELGAKYGKTLPTVTKGNAEGKNVSTSQWVVKDGKEATDKKTAFTTDSAVNEQTTVVPNEDAATSYRTVTFNTSYADSDAPKAQNVSLAGTATQPSAPSKKDAENLKYKFAGWYQGSQFNTANDPASGVKSGAKAWNFSSDKVYNDVTLYAAFEVSEVRVQFDPNYGTEAVQSKWFKTGDYFESPTITNGNKVATFYAGTEAAPEGKKLTVKGEELTYVVSDGGEGTTTKSIVAGTVYKAEYESATNDTLSILEAKVNLNKSASSQNLTEGSFAQYKKDFETYLADKAAKAANGYTVAEYAELIKELKGFQAKLIEVADTPLYRLYNPNNGDHYYTIRQYEAAALTALGWRNEGTPYRVLAKSNLGAGVYVVYNPNTGEHLLTSDKDEAKSLAKIGWKNQGIEFYAPQGAKTAVFRVYNPNTTGPAHHYASQGEASGLVNLGWRWDNNAAALFYFE